MAFSATVKMVAETSFDVNKTTQNICRHEKPVSNVASVIEQSLFEPLTS